MAFRDRPGSDADFLGALAVLPQSEAELREWLLGKFGMHIEKNPGLSFDESGRPQPMVSAVGGNPFPQQDDYTWVYFHLIEEKGEERAADIVSELILSKGGARVLEIVKLEAANEDLFIRADDPEGRRLAGVDWSTSCSMAMVGGQSLANTSSITSSAHVHLTPVRSWNKTWLKIPHLMRT